MWLVSKISWHEAYHQWRLSYRNRKRRNEGGKIMKRIVVSIYERLACGGIGNIENIAKAAITLRNNSAISGAEKHQAA
jgi:hypothetical protein